MHISATRYLEKTFSRFIKVIEDNEEINEDGRKVEMVSDSEEKTKKRALRKEKRDVRALSFAATRPSASAVPISGSSTLPSASTFTLSILVHRFAPPSMSSSAMSVHMIGSAPPTAFLSRVFVPVPLSVFGVFISIFASLVSLSLLTMSSVSVLLSESSAPSFASGVSVTVLGLFAPLSILLVSGMFMLLPRLLALLSMSAMYVLVTRLFNPPSVLSIFVVSVPMPGLSSLLFPTWLSL